MWILEQFGVYIVIALGAIAALFGVRQSGKSAGRDEVRREQQDAAAKMREKAREVGDAMDAKSDDAVRADARRWVRNRGE